MAVKTYAELTLLTKFHQWSYHNDEAPSARSCAFTLDSMYLDTDVNEEGIALKKECLERISQGFDLSEAKLDASLSDLQKEIESNGGTIVPFDESAILDASKSITPGRLLDDPLTVDLIWSQPLIWRLFSIFNRSQYLTVAAFHAKAEGLIQAKTFRSYYKAMMNRPLTHALHQVVQHAKPFQDFRLSS